MRALCRKNQRRLNPVEFDTFSKREKPAAAISRSGGFFYFFSAYENYLTTVCCVEPACDNHAFITPSFWVMATVQIGASPFRILA